MQTSIDAVAVSAASHQTNMILPSSDGQFIVRDTRLKDWVLAQSGELDFALPVVARLMDNGEILRIRTLEDDTLEVVYATPGDVLTWSANTSSFSALAGTGVDIFIDDNVVDAFWVGLGGVDIRTAQSTDYGHTWGPTSIVATVDSQPDGTLVQLCAPHVGTVVFSDSSLLTDRDDNPLTILYVSVRDGGLYTDSWSTPVQWDFAGQYMGIEAKVRLRGRGRFHSNLSGVSVETGQMSLAFYSDMFRESFETGLWVSHVTGIEETDTPVLYWEKPIELFQTLRIDDSNEATQIFTSFPHIQQIGEEYWVSCIESSVFADHERYHLAFFRCTDIRAWSDRDYRQGAAYDRNSFEDEGAYCYNDTTPFALTDLIYGNLVVTPERTFIVSYDRVFFCPSTYLVGEDNPAKKLDLTPLVGDWSVSLPQAPTAGTASYKLLNVPMNYTPQDILAAHRGIILYQEAGYNIEEEDVLIPVGQFHVDEVTQNSAIDNSDGSISAMDNTLLLNRWKSDIYFDIPTGQQASYEKFCDTTGFITTHGYYSTSTRGNLRPGWVKPEDNFLDNIAVLNTDRADDGDMVVRFRCDDDWTDNHVGIAFQGQLVGASDDNLRFYACIYNRHDDGKFALYRAQPREGQAKLYRYRELGVESSVINLDVNTAYWMKVAVNRQHVMVWYTSDIILPDGNHIPYYNWTLVIDHVFEGEDSLPARLGWWGLIATETRQPSGPVGQLGTKAGMQDLMDGSGNPLVIALHVTTGDLPGILRRVNVALTQENEGQNAMPDAQIMLVSGDSSSPDDLTDSDNILFIRNASSLYFGVHDQPDWTGANDKPNPSRQRYAANSDLWICVTFNGTLETGQSYKWAADDTGDYGTNQTKFSSDGGETWQDFADANLNLAACIELEYLQGRVKFSKMFFADTTAPQTMEQVAHKLAAKAGVLDITPDSWLVQADLTLGPDDILWQPESFGKIASFVMDADVANCTYLRFLLRSRDIDDGDEQAYRIELDQSNQLVYFYGKTDLLQSVTKPFSVIPTDFHLTVINDNFYLYVYINHVLIATWYKNKLDRPGYVGFDSIGADWSNIRIPDLRQIVAFFSVSARETGTAALQRLVAKPEANSIRRAKYFIRYDGSLRISSFSRREIVDTYEDTLITTVKSETQRNAVSQLQPTGNFYAVRWDGKVVLSDGRIYDERDYVAASSDEDAYESAEVEFNDAAEMFITPRIDHAANFAMEREDLNQLVEPISKTAGPYIVNSINFRGNANEQVQGVDYRMEAPE